MSRGFLYFNRINANEYNNDLVMYKIDEIIETTETTIISINKTSVEIVPANPKTAPSTKIPSEAKNRTIGSHNLKIMHKYNLNTFPIFAKPTVTKSMIPVFSPRDSLIIDAKTPNENGKVIIAINKDIKDEIILSVVKLGTMFKAKVKIIKTKLITIAVPHFPDRFDKASFFNAEIFIRYLLLDNFSNRSPFLKLLFIIE